MNLIVKLENYLSTPVVEEGDWSHFIRLGNEYLADRGIYINLTEEDVLNYLKEHGKNYIDDQCIMVVAK